MKLTSLVATTGTPQRHRQSQRAGDALLLAGAPGALQLEVEAVAEQRQPGFERSTGRVIVAREQRPADVAFPRAGQRDQAGRAVGVEPCPVQQRPMAPLPFEVGPRHEPGQVAVAAVVLAEQHEAARLRALALLAQQRIHAHERLDPARLRRTVELHEREEIALVGQRHGGHAEPRAGIHQALARELAVLVLAVDAHDAVHERVLGVHVQVDEAGHGGRHQRESQDCTGAKLRRCTGEGPRRRSAAMCAAVG